MSLAGGISALATRIATEIKTVKGLIDNKADIDHTHESSGGGGGGADNAGRNYRRPFPSPRVNDWVAMPGSSVAGRSLTNGELVLGWCFLPEGTYDTICYHLNNASSTGGTLKFIAYNDDNNRVGSLLLQSTSQDSTGFTGSRTITGISLVIPAGGLGFWGGLVSQGNPSSSPNLVGIDRSAETVPFSAQPNLLWANTANCWQINSVTGSAPATPTVSVSGVSGVRMAFKRSA